MDLLDLMTTCMVFMMVCVELIDLMGVFVRFVDCMGMFVWCVRVSGLVNGLLI